MKISDLQIDHQLDQLLKLHPKRIDLSLDRIKKLLSKLDSPQDKIKNIIHIAGTNGKFSTLKFIQSILGAMNRTTNAYISPHLIRFNERFELNDKIIDNESLSAILNEVKSTNAAKPITFFEITSACFFLAAARTQADYTLLEVGLGGRLDSSNVMTPKLSVITSISNDHHDFLGDTLEKSAFEKAGIIKPNVPVIIGKQPYTEALEVLIKQAKKLKAPAFIYNEDWNIKLNENKICYSDEKGEIFLDPLNINGEFQLYNLGLAIAATRKIENQNIKNALSHNPHLKIKLPGRIQQINNGKYFKLISPQNELFLDGSHNEDAAFQLNLAMQNIPQVKDLVMILGMINTKDPINYVKQLRGIVAIKTITIPDEVSAIPAEQLSSILTGLVSEVSPANSIKEAIRSLSNEYPRARILICGSLYLAGQVLKYN